MTTPYIAEYRGNPGTTPFMRLQDHIKHHQYKKGAYQGAAPADTSRRSKSHFRVESHGYWIDVIFHHTAILRAFDDGRVVLNTDGYETAPTTRAAMQDALFLAGYRGWLQSDTRNGYRNTVLNLAPAKGAAWIKVGWSDVITISATGEVTGYAPIKTYRADKEARKAWRAHPDVQEFKAVLPILLAGLESQGRVYPPYGLRGLSDAVTNREQWPAAARYLAYTSGFDPDAAWAYLDRAATEDMRVVVDVEE